MVQKPTCGRDERRPCPLVVSSHSCRVGRQEAGTFPPAARSEGPIKDLPGTPTRDWGPGGSKGRYYRRMRGTWLGGRLMMIPDQQRACCSPVSKRPIRFHPHPTQFVSTPPQSIQKTFIIPQEAILLWSLVVSKLATRPVNNTES